MGTLPSISSNILKFNLQSAAMRTLLALAVLAAAAESLSIQDAAITSGNGEDEDNPADEGSSITLRCGLSNADNGWVYCGWTHELANVYDDNDDIVEVFCSSADYTQSSAQCKNLGGSEVLDQANYASRLRMDVSQTCGRTAARCSSTSRTTAGRSRRRALRSGV